MAPYLQIHKLRKLFYALAVILFVHASLLSTKTFFINGETYESKEVYKAKINYEVKESDDDINTQTKYLYILPKESLIVVYFGYLLVAIGFVRNLKTYDDN